jgi:hypothetical protein
MTGSIEDNKALLDNILNRKESTDINPRMGNA